MKYNPFPIQKGQNRICTFAYCEDIADCSSQVYNYLVSCKWPKLAVPLLLESNALCISSPSLLVLVGQDMREGDINIGCHHGSTSIRNRSLSISSIMYVLAPAQFYVLVYSV